MESEELVLDLLVVVGISTALFSEMLNINSLILINFENYST